MEDHTEYMDSGVYEELTPEPIPTRENTPDTLPPDYYVNHNQTNYSEESKPVKWIRPHGIRSHINKDKSSLRLWRDIERDKKKNQEQYSRDKEQLKEEIIQEVENEYYK